MKRRFMRLTAWTLTFLMAFAFLLPVWAEGEGDGSLSPEDPQLVSRKATEVAPEKNPGVYKVTLKFMVPDEAMLDLPDDPTVYVMLGSCDFIETSKTSPTIEKDGSLLKVTIPALKHTGTGNSLSATIVFEYKKGAGTHQKSFQVSTNLPDVGNVPPEQPLDGTSKFIGYKITSAYGWITKNSAVNIDLYIMDVDLLKNPDHPLKELYLSLNDCSFTYDNLPINGERFLKEDEELKKKGIFIVSLNNIRYSGTGKSLSVELGYQIGGTEKTCPITATINECIEWTEPEPPEPPSSSDPIVLDSLKPNILLESFSIRSLGKPKEEAAQSDDENGKPVSTEGTSLPDETQKSGTENPNTAGGNLPPMEVKSGETSEDGPENGITAGVPFELSFALKNTSRNLAVQNMVIKVDGGEKFRLQNGTDTLYVENLAPQKISSQTLNFITPANTEPGSYPVTLAVSFEYYDKDAKLSGDASLTLSLPVGSMDRIRINSLSVPTENYVGSDLSLSYSIINAGFTTLYNSEILVYDENQQLLSSRYVGTMEPAKEAKGSDINLNFMEPGEHTLRVVFRYEDEMLAQSSTEQSCMVNVMEYDIPAINPEPMPDPDFPLEEEGTFPWWLVWTGAAVVLLAGGGVTAGVLMKKRKAKIQAELEDYDEDL